MTRLLITVLCMLSVTFASRDKLPTKEVVTVEQKQVLNYACEVGRWLKHKDGDLCYVMAAITWRESRAGVDKGYRKGHPSHGIFQNYKITVRNRLKQNGIRMSFPEIREMLFDDEVSGFFAQAEMLDWLKYHKGNLYRSIASYNGGFAWRKTTRYADQVLEIANYLKKTDHIFN